MLWRYFFDWCVFDMFCDFHVFLLWCELDEILMWFDVNVIFAVFWCDVCLCVFERVLKPLMCCSALGVLCRVWLLLADQSLMCFDALFDVVCTECDLDVLSCGLFDVTVILLCFCALRWCVFLRRCVLIVERFRCDVSWMCFDVLWCGVMRFDALWCDVSWMQFWCILL